jgi:predicted HTH transcriptional regulator
MMTEKQLKEKKRNIEVILKAAEDYFINLTSLKRSQMLRELEFINMVLNENQKEQPDNLDKIVNVNSLIREGTYKDKILKIIKESPGITEREICTQLGGIASPTVNQLVRTLLQMKLIKREGKGVNQDPFRHYSEQLL